MSNFIKIDDNYIRKDTIDTYRPYCTSHEMWDEDKNETYIKHIWRVKLILKVDVSLNCKEIFDSKKEALEWINQQYDEPKPITLPPIRNPYALTPMPPLRLPTLPIDVFNNTTNSRHTLESMYKLTDNSKKASNFLPPISKN